MVKHLNTTIILTETKKKEGNWFFLSLEHHFLLKRQESQCARYVLN